MLEGKGKLGLKWADSLDEGIGDGDSMEVSDNNANLVGDQLGRPRQCNGTCWERIGALEPTLDRFADMVDMLAGAGGLVSPAMRLAVGQHKGKMAREWDESVFQASERAKAEAVVNAAEKRVHKRAEQEKRAEEA